MLRSYWDEGGSSADPGCRFMGIVGLVASTEGWERFGPMWKGALDDFGLTHFHMKDFAHWKGQFADRSLWQEPRRRELVGRLLDAIAAAVPRIHGGVMDLTAWRALTDEERGYFIDPWYPCMQECVRLASVYAQVDGEDVEFVFSQHSEFGGRAKLLWETIKASKHRPVVDKLGPFSMPDMRNVLPLQAADLVAYEYIKASAPLTTGEFSFRVPFQRLLDIDPRTFVSFIDAGMLAWQVEGARRGLSRVESSPDVPKP
jgi:hypothetical protein